MDKDLTQFLFKLLAVLSDATKKISDILCREVSMGASAGLAMQTEFVTTVAEQVRHVTSALERLQRDADDAPQDAMTVEDTPAAEDPIPKVRRRGRLTITEGELRKLYIEENLPARIIADRYQVSAAAINQRLRLWGILKRGTRAVRPIPAIAEGPVEGSDLLKTSVKNNHSFEPDPAAIHEAEAAFHVEEAPAAKVGSNKNFAKRHFKLVSRRRS